jgi:hypothetical protein
LNKGIATLLLGILYLPSPGEGSCFPSNGQYPVRIHTRGLSNPRGPSISEMDFYRITEDFFRIYDREFKAKELQLVIDRDWTEPMSIALADRQDHNALVIISGGVARRPLMTQEALVLVLCHEFGHHLGGAPKHPERIWGSVEGEADYYATLKCYRRYLTEGSPLPITSAANEFKTLIEERCRNSFETESAQEICRRSLSVSQTMGRVLAEPQESEPRLDRSDDSLSDIVLLSHPRAQCRLDTFASGALCPVSQTSQLSDTDSAVGTCTQTEGWSIGFRPRCWFGYSQLP